MKLCLGLFLLGVFFSQVSLAESPRPGKPAIEIQGDTRVREGFPLSLALFVRDQPVHDSDPAAYSPTALAPDGSPIYAPRQSPLEIYWDFGDGSAAVLTNDFVSVSHVYEEEGNYTVAVSARDLQGEFATATHDVYIYNADPKFLTVAAVEVEPENYIVEFTATATDTLKDSELTFTWDFGDGETATGVDLWWSRHEYPAPGVYEVKLSVTDDDYPSSFGTNKRYDGSKEITKKVRLEGIVPPGFNFEESEVMPLADLTNQLSGEVEGVFSSTFNGDIRHFRGLYLQNVSPGTCRFMFTAWDDSKLAHVLGMVDLHGVPEGGGRYKVNSPKISLGFAAKRSTYVLAKKSWIGPAGEAGLGGFAQAALSRALAGAPELSAEQKQRVDDQLDKVGLDAKSRSPGSTPSLPENSPLGLEDGTNFSVDGGELELDFIPGDRAVGKYDLTMSTEFGPLKGEMLGFHGSFNLDLEAARRDGLVSYSGCEPPTFEVVKTWPPDGREHFPVDRAAISASFSQQVDPATVTDQNFQITYMNTAGDPVAIPARILRDPKAAYLVPESPLMPGVVYTIGLKAGDTGIRSSAGAPLEDPGQDDWYTWKFTTKVDLIPEPAQSLQGSQKILACDIYQTIRNPPLIVGKPAIARVFAKWQRQAGVHKDHQVKQFKGRVVLQDAAGEELRSVTHTFVRPDLWEAWGIDKRAAEHSAQVIGFVPAKDIPGPLRFAIEVDTGSSLGPEQPYLGRCPMELWDLRPKLTIDFVALPFREWTGGTNDINATLPILQEIADASVEYAWQQFPFANIVARKVHVLPFEEGQWYPEPTMPGANGPIRCGAQCLLNGANPFPGFKEWLIAKNDPPADIIIAFGPHYRLGGAFTGRNLRRGPGVVLSLASSDRSLFPRYIFGLVHELGHVLDIEHVPANGGSNEEALAQRGAIESLRERGVPFEYNGIEGLRMSPDGARFWNKSSSEGNEEGSGDDYRLFPLMFPSTIPTKNAFIANHQYRKIQRFLEEIHWPSN